jgi:hypothetical protein
VFRVLSGPDRAVGVGGVVFRVFSGPDRAVGAGTGVNIICVNGIIDDEDVVSLIVSLI